MKHGKIYATAMAAVSMALIAGTASAATISISCGALGRDAQDCILAAEAWAAKTGHDVRLVQASANPAERLALYKEALAGNGNDIDVFQVNRTWSSSLAPHFINLTSYFSADDVEQFIPTLAATSSIDDRIVYAPWIADMPVLFYRGTLLEKHGLAAPKTWAEFFATAKAVQDAERRDGNADFWGFVWQGGDDQDLTAMALEWMAGHVVEQPAEGASTLASAITSTGVSRAADAINRAAGWLGVISPPNILSYSAADAESLFASGNALFMRQPAHVWSNLVKAGAGGFSISPLPPRPDGAPSAAMDGWYLAVSKYSQHPEVAADLVRYLASRDEQKRRAIEAGVNPAISGLYGDADVRSAQPAVAQFKALFDVSGAHPSAVLGKDYEAFSAAFGSAVRAALSGNAVTANSLAGFAGQVDRLAASGNK